MLLDILLILVSSYEVFKLTQLCHVHMSLNWSLAQAHQQSFIGLSQSLTSMKGAREKAKAGFMINIQNQLVLVPSSVSLSWKPHADTSTESGQGGS